jgi:hypothetical protein
MTNVLTQGQTNHILIQHNGMHLGRRMCLASKRIDSILRKPLVIYPVQKNLILLPHKIQINPNYTLCPFPKDLF